MPTCDYAAVLEEAKCFPGLGSGDLELAQVGALLRWTAAVNPSLEITPNAILERGKCLQGLDDWQLDILITQLLCNLSTGTSSADADVEAFLLCSGITDDTQVEAITDLVDSLKTNSLWTSFDAIYPFVGGSSTAHSCNLRDTSKYSITWAGTVTHNANGITGNGSTGYGDTGFNPTTASSPQFSLNAASIGCYCKTASLLTTSSFMGCNSGVSGYANLSTFVLVSNFVSLQGLNTSTSVTQGATSFAGQIIASRTASNAQIVYSPSGQASSSAASVAIPNQNAYLLAANNAGSAVGFITANLAFAFIGSGLSDSQITTLKSIILTYQTALGRA